MKFAGLSCINSSDRDRAFLLMLSLIILMATFFFILPNFYKKTLSALNAVDPSILELKPWPSRAVSFSKPWLWKNTLVDCFSGIVG